MSLRISLRHFNIIINNITDLDLVIIYTSKLIVTFRYHIDLIRNESRISHQINRYHPLKYRLLSISVDSD